MKKKYAVDTVVHITCQMEEQQEKRGMARKNYHTCTVIPIATGDI